MRRLALSDEILLDIEKPARYIGGEGDFLMKNKKKGGISVSICFPDVK